MADEEASKIGFVPSLSAPADPSEVVIEIRQDGEQVLHAELHPDYRTTCERDGEVSMRSDTRLTFLVR